MFKKLKQTLENSVDAATSAVTSASGGRINLQKSPESQSNAQSANQKSDKSSSRPLDDSVAVDSPSNGATVQTPVDVLINLQDDTTSTDLSISTNSNYLSAAASVLSSSVPPDGEYDASPAELPITPLQEHHSRSRTSSFSSVTSDASIFTPVSLVTHQYVLPSDAESYSEVEDTGPSLNTISKEDLYRYFLKMQRRSEKYKGKFSQVVTAYKELERERDKLKNTLTQCQDKAFRRISELKEQIQLDQVAKQHIEENYALMIEEKQELIKVLHMQVRLLKDGKEIPEELVVKATRVQQNADQLEQMTSTPMKESNDHSQTDSAASNLVLKDKVKRLEVLLGKCKDTIKNNKERIKQLTADHEELQRHLEERDSVITSTKESHKEVVEKLRSQLKEARSVVEELETSKVLEIAAAKQHMHSALEENEAELAAAREGIQASRIENERLLEKLEKLEKAGKDQLEKSREVMRRLKEEKKQLEEEMKMRIDVSVGKLEEEREGEVQELKRGKVEALRLMQQQMEERIAALTGEKDKCLAEKDRFWEEKLTAKEQQVQMQLMAELQKTLETKEEEMKLAIEERELQKMAALSHSDAEKDELREQVGRLTEDVARLKKSLQESCVDQESELAAELSKLRQDKENLAIKSESEQKEHEQSLSNLVQQIESLRLEKVDNEKRNDEMSERLKEISEEKESLGAELKSLCEKLSQKMAAHEESLKLDRENHARETTVLKEKLSAEEAENVKLMSQLDTKVQELQSRTEQLMQKTSAYEESAKMERENHEKEMNAVNERLTALDAENTQVKAQLDSKIQELSLKEAEYEEGMRLEREHRERELVRKVEELEVQQSGSCQELGEKLSAANETISQLEKTVQTLTLHELELNNQLKNVQSEFDKTVIELERAAADYEEVKIAKNELNMQLQNLQSAYDSTVLELNTQLQHVQSERDSKVLELTTQLENVQLKYEQTVSDLTSELEKMKSERDSASEHSGSELEKMKSDYEMKLAAANDHVAMYEQKVNSLIERENLLNTELEQVKNEYETQITSQNETLASMHTTIDMLKNNEIELRSQIESTRSECETRLDRASAENKSEVANLQSLVENNQSNLMQVISELEASKAELDKLSAEASDQVTEKQSELEAARNLISQFEEQLIDIQTQKISPLETELAEKISENEALKKKLAKLDSELKAKIAACGIADEKVTHLQQSESEARSLLAETVEQRQCLENKMSVLEVNLSSEDEMVLSLKNEISSKERKITELEACVTSERDSHWERLSNLENQVREKQTELEKKDEELVLHHEMLQQKKKELDEKTKLFEQLRQEAKNKLHDLKAKLQEANEALERKEREMDMRLGEELQAFEAAMVEMEQRFDAERGAFQLDHQAEVKVLNDRLDKERENMKTFKENVKKQFDQRHEQTKLTIGKLKERFQDTAKDNEDIFKRKTERLEKLKEKEKASAVQEVKDQMKETISNLESSVNELRAQVTTAEERLKEAESEKEELTKQNNLMKEELDQQHGEKNVQLSSEMETLQKTNFALTEQVKAIQNENTELENERTVVGGKFETESQEKASLVQELEKNQIAAREAMETIAQLESSQSVAQEQIQSLNTSLQEANSRLGEMQLERDQLVTATEHNISQTMDEKLKEAEVWKSAHLQECSKTLEEKKKSIAELEEKIDKFKVKVQLKLKEQDKIMAEKDGCLKTLQEMYDQVVVAKKASDDRVVELENKVAVMITEESELQARLDEMKNKLVTSEENLQHIKKMVDDCKSQRVEEQKTGSDHVGELEKKLAEYEQEVSEKDKAVSHAKSKVETLELELSSQCEKKKEELAATEKQWQEKFAQLKQKYMSKLKEFQVQHNGAEKSSQGRLELVEARNVEIEAQLLEISSAREECERGQKEAIERLTSKEEEIKMLNGKILELENQVTKIQNEHMDKAKLELANVESRISEQQDQVSKLEAELRGKETLILTLQQEKEALLSDSKELVRVHDEEKETLQADFAVRLKSAESVLQESIQKSESGQHTEVKLKVLVTNLKREKEELNKQISQLEKKLAAAESALREEKKDRETDNQNSEAENEVELGRLQAEYKQRMEELELEHSSKVKQLLKTFNLKMTEKEKEFQDTYSTIMDRSTAEESRLLRDHKEEVEDLHRDLNERDEKIDSLIDDYQVKVQATEEMANAEIKELQQKVTALEDALEKKESELEKAIEGHVTQQVEARMRQREEEMVGLSVEWAAERQSRVSCDPSAAQLPDSEDLLQQTQAAILATHTGSTHTDWLKERVIELTRTIEELKIKHKLELAEGRSQREMKEGQLPQPLLAPTTQQGVFSGGGEGDECQQGNELQQLELYNMNLQAQVIQQSGENAKLKIQERELRHKIVELERQTAGDSLANPLQTDTTEMEYLRNIIFEYMMGRETKTLCKVITTVLQFSDEQKRKILEKEETKVAHRFATLLYGNTTGGSTSVASRIAKSSKRNDSLPDPVHL